MVALPGLLIEYLITGSGALLALWIASALEVLSLPSWLEPNLLSPAVLGAIIPTVYVVGMAVDFLSKLMTGALSVLIDDFWYPMIEKIVRPKVPSGFQKLLPRKKKKYDEPLTTAEIFAKSERLSLQSEMRSSRDRIARGAFLNVSMLTIMVTWEAVFADHGKLDLAGLCIALAVIAFFMWRRFARLSSRWKSKAGKALKKSEELAAQRTLRGC